MRGRADIVARDKAMRQARDEILRRIGIWLRDSDFSKAGAGHFIREHNQWTLHVGFQKLSSGRSVRVLCHISSESDASRINGPRSDDYQRRESPNGIRYHLAWSTREADVGHCTDEFCRYLRDVVFQWFTEQGKDLRGLQFGEE